jgi:hypothetical protein
VVIGGAVAFSLLEIAVGFAPNFVVAMVLLLPAGFFSMYTAQAANQRMQMGVDAEYRGRVMSLYVLVFLGTTPIGASVVGWWGEHFGVPASIWCAGLVCLTASVTALVWQLRMSGDRIELHRRPRLRLVLVRHEEPDVAAPGGLPGASVNPSEDRVLADQVGRTGIPVRADSI